MQNIVLLLVGLGHRVIYVYNVVVLFELLDEFLDCLATLGIQLLRIGRDIDTLT